MCNNNLYNVSIGGGQSSRSSDRNADLVDSTKNLLLMEAFKAWWLNKGSSTRSALHLYIISIELSIFSYDTIHRKSLLPYYVYFSII